ncbi:MAG: hypothetical protein DWQ01_20035 [Planctomycetota bacterium]|nr:MAG: hypothetical protein DWQ01_20035 [Planctomycetota bacterium]
MQQPSIRLKSIPKRAGEGGSILFLTLLFTGVLAMLSATFTSSVRTHTEISRDGHNGLKAELAATSGLEYCRRRLFEDPEWSGPDGGSMDLGSAGTFSVSRLDTQSNYYVPHIAELEIQGQFGSSRYRIQADINVDPGDLVRSQALVGLGGKMKLHNCSFQGDLTVPDKLGVVWDYHPDLMAWLPAPITSIATLQFTSTALNGTLYKYTDTVHVDASKEIKTEQEIFMPAWNLDDYIVPGPDRIIYTGVTSLQNVTLDKTAVFILDPGDDLELRDVTFNGGMVVYCESNYDLRSGPRNEIEFKKVNFVGGGDQGIHPHLGLLAPACEVEESGSMEITIEGFSFCNRLDKVTHLDVYGQMVVVDEMDNLNNAHFYYRDTVTDTPPPGIDYRGPKREIDILSIREAYDEFTPPEGFGYDIDN